MCKIFILLMCIIFCTKVVEILARNLENEGSLHKRVDLFFLVDSITQCSRGLKGSTYLVACCYYWLYIGPGHKKGMLVS